MTRLPAGRLGSGHAPEDVQVSADRRLVWLVALFMWLALACNSSGRAAPSLAPASPKPAALPSPALPTSTPTAEPPPAADLAEALYQGIESGRWTQAQGVIAVLRLLAGEIPAAEVLPAQGVVRGEGTRVFSLAQQLLDGDELTADDRAEIERLLRLIVPSSDDLDRFATSEPASSGRGGGLAAPSAQGEDCEEIWREVWADERLTMCFFRREFGGGRDRLYYPASWAGSNDRMAYVDAAEEAVQISHDVFIDLGLALPRVYVVFSLLPAERLGGEWGWDASTASWLSPCPILVYPQGLDPDRERYKQILAHEMFHCVQGTNFSAQMSVGTPTYDWWVEGTAEYFGNVAFPDADAENQYLDSFDFLSQNDSLLAMSYENFLFFQHWANEAGDRSILDFLRLLPTDPGWDQAQALAGAPDMQDRFHRFGQLYVEENIRDAGGRDLVPVHASEMPVSFPSTTVDAIPPAEAFVLKRYGLLFPEDRSFTLSVSTDGADGRSSARTLDTLVWGALPPEIRAGCQPVTYHLVVTSAAPGGGGHHLVLDVNVDEVRGCDECLLGRWELVNETYPAYFMATLGSPDNVTLESTEGVTWTAFLPDMTQVWGYDAFRIEFIQTMTNPFGNPLEVGTVLEFEGGGTATYFARDGLLSHGESTYDATIHVSVGGTGVTLASGETGFEGADAGRDLLDAAVPYVCQADTAHFGPVHDVPTDLLEWRRVEP